MDDANRGTGGWNPEQYERFRAERMQPFFDLLALVRAAAPGATRAVRAVDLGCGTGELTALLAERLPAGSRVEGIDSSAAMLARAAPRASERVRFAQRGVADALPELGAYDLVFAHATLQWLPDHERLVPALLAALAPGAELAVQVPDNFAHPSHTVAAALAREPRFAGQFAPTAPGTVAAPGVLPLERYAELLYAGGLREQVCVTRVYGHELPSSAAVVEWVRGTLLTAYLPRLPDEATRAAFLDAYRDALLAAIGDRAPYFYAFRRTLLWGRKAAA